MKHCKVWSLSEIEVRSLCQASPYPNDCRFIAAYDKVRFVTIGKIETIVARDGHLLKLEDGLWLPSYFFKFEFEPGERVQCIPFTDQQSLKPLYQRPSQKVY